MIDNRYGYSTLEQAVYETLNYLIYSNPNFSHLCQISHSVGVEEITARDQFMDSRQKIATKIPLQYTYGWKTNHGCDQISTGVVEIYGVTGPYCGGATPYPLWLSDVDSYACYSAVENTPAPPKLCTAMFGNPILSPTREKIEFGDDIIDSWGLLVFSAISDGTKS